MKKVMALLILILILFQISGKGQADQYETDFNWRASEGESIKVFLNQHPLGEAIIRDLPEFEDLTGIKVLYSITPEENYFDKVTTSLSSRSGTPDIFMIGAYQIWEYVYSGYLQDIDHLFEDPINLSPEYDIDDFFPEVIEALRWDGITGHSVGNGPLWGLPLVFETNSLAYNKRIFKERGLNPPESMDELLKLCIELQNFNGPDSYALAIRGSINWNTIHAGYMTTFANYEAVDYVLEHGKLISKVDSENSIAATEMWVRLIKHGGPEDWANYTWYQAGADLGAGRAAMMFDADNNSFNQNQYGFSQEAGNIGWVPAPPVVKGQKPKANMWIWALSMNKMTQNKLASWLFLQYYTSKEFALKAATKYLSTDPPRKSVYFSPGFQKILKRSPGYAEVFQSSLKGTQIRFTPQPGFMDVAREWALVLHDIISGKYNSTSEGMKILKQKMDEIASSIE